MRQNRRIEFDPDWFDYKSDKTPEGHRPSPAAPERQTLPRDISEFFTRRDAKVPPVF